MKLMPVVRICCTPTRLVSARFRRYRGFLEMSSTGTQPTKKNGPFRVFCTRKLPDSFLAPLVDNPAIDLSFWPSEKTPVSREALLEGVQKADGLLCLLTDRVDREVLDAGLCLRVVSTMSVGYEHIDIAACHERNVRVGHTPDVLTDSTAELAVALLLASARRLPEASAAVREGKWGKWDPTFMLGSGISGSTVGVVGMGRIGRAFAHIIKSFKANVLYCGNTPKPDVGKELGAEFVEFEELLRRSDFVVALCALTPLTRQMFNANAFSLMKSTAVFVNVSRGAVVDQDALETALREGQIRGAGLDVTVPEPLPPCHPLLALSNCIVLPHIGSAEERTRQAMGQLAARNMLAALNGQPIPAEVGASH